LIGDSPTALADRLLLETMLGEDSDFYPYLQMLPLPLEDPMSSLLQMPRFWKDSTNYKARLDSISTWDGGQLQERLRVAEEDPDKEEEKLVDPWALAVVKSRSNFLEDGRYAMTPILDMLNHDASITTKARILKEPSKGFQKDNNSETTTLQHNGPALELSVLNHSFKAGDEIFMSYGDLTNLDTLCDYGFVSENNPANVECLSVRLILSPDPILVAVLADGTIAPESLASLRRVLASASDLKGKDKQQLSDFLTPLSDSNELEVVSFLASEFDVSAKDARRGALEAATVRQDKLVTTYLSSRAVVFEKGIETILQKYPDLEYC